MAGAGPYVTPQPAREPLVSIVGVEMGLDRVTLLALMAHRSCDCRNPDLAVAVVEVRVLPGGVLLLLRCFHTHIPELQSYLVLSPWDLMW